MTKKEQLELQAMRHENYYEAQLRFWQERRAVVEVELYKIEEQIQMCVDEITKAQAMKPTKLTLVKNDEFIET